MASARNKARYRKPGLIQRFNRCMRHSQDLRAETKRIGLLGNNLNPGEKRKWHRNQAASVASSASYMAANIVPIVKLTQRSTRALRRVNEIGERGVRRGLETIERAKAFRLDELQRNPSLFRKSAQNKIVPGGGKPGLIQAPHWLKPTTAREQRALGRLADRWAAPHKTKVVAKFTRFTDRNVRRVNKIFDRGMNKVVKRYLITSPLLIGASMYINRKQKSIVEASLARRRGRKTKK